ncbi:unnamed protein product [Rhizoctonia solani]|uniref:Uncharacterized protein n=1 Tax=Rhizoctonia solani TaxID=456999 RepID=A0A8H2X256_9AGAM|nr:unnamed protein product [Rhizoctonia solani]
MPFNNPGEGKPDAENHSETTIQEYLGQEGPHDILDSHNDPRVEHSTETAAPHIETTVTLQDRIAISPRNASGQDPTGLTSPERESNYKLGTLPPSPRLQPQSPSRARTPSQTEDTEGEASLMSYSAEQNEFNVQPYDPANAAGTPDRIQRNEPSAAGRYWIRFHQESDAVSFMAYMALQSTKTVCIISNQKPLMSAYAKALERITKFPVFHPTDLNCLQLTDPLVQSFITYTSPAILLLSPDRPLELNIMDLQMDCAVYWGIPWSAEYYRSRVLARSPLNILSCLILTTSELGLDPKSYGTIEYPVEFLKSISEPFKNMRNTAGSILAGLKLGRAMSTDISAVSRTSGIHDTHLHGRNLKSMPAGHYYVTLDSMHDLDIIPLIAYIALNSKKVMCYLPGDKQIEFYQKQLDALATVNAIVAPGKGKARVQLGIDQLRSSRYGILLRHTGGDLGQSFTKDLADCLIYFGLPSNPSLHAKTVSTKVSHSYLIFADPKRTGLPRRLSTMNPPLEKHPFLQDLSDAVDGPALYDLRVRFLTALSA